MLAHAVVRDHPRHGGQLPATCGGEEARDRRDVVELMVTPDRREVREGVPDPRRLRALKHRATGHRAGLAVRLLTGEDVVAPGDVMLVHQVREVGPGVLRHAGRRVQRLVRRRHRLLDRVATTPRVTAAGTARRPLGDHEQVSRQAPGRVRLEHVVLENEVPRVRPVVRDLPLVVVAHHGRGLNAANAIGRVARAVGSLGEERATDEAVHSPVVDVPQGVRVLVRPAPVVVRSVVVRLDARVEVRIRKAHSRDAVSHRDPVRARVGAEVGVEGAVLLHDHDDVPDLVDAGRRGARVRVVREREDADRPGDDQYHGQKGPPQGGEV